MAAPPVPIVPPSAGASGWLSASVVLGVLAVVATGWLVAEYRRRLAQAEQTVGWRTAYWHLLATATCPLCGSRMESVPAAEPAPSYEPQRGEL